MIRRPPRSTLSSSSAASDVYKRQIHLLSCVCGSSPRAQGSSRREARAIPSLSAMSTCRSSSTSTTSTSAIAAFSQVTPILIFREAQRARGIKDAKEYVSAVVSALGKRKANHECTRYHIYAGSRQRDHQVCQGVHQQTLQGYIRHIVLSTRSGCSTRLRTFIGLSGSSS